MQDSAHPTHPTGAATATGGVRNDDPKARDLLRRAFATTYRWPRDFAGFEAAIRCLGSDQPLTGRATIRLPKDVAVTLANEWAQQWVHGQISSMVIHRSPRDFDESDGRHVLTLGEDETHPSGRQVVIHGDGMGSTYRVKDDRIIQINRQMGPMKFSINVHKTVPTPDGRQLVQRYLVYYLSPADGKISQVEHYEDRYVSVGPVMLPASRQVTFAQEGQVLTLTIAFTEHRLL